MGRVHRKNFALFYAGLGLLSSGVGLWAPATQGDDFPRYQRERQTEGDGEDSFWARPIRFSLGPSFAPSDSESEGSGSPRSVSLNPWDAELGVALGARATSASGTTTPSAEARITFQTVYRDWLRFGLQGNVMADLTDQSADPEKHAQWIEAEWSVDALPLMVRIRDPQNPDSEPALRFGLAVRGRAVENTPSAEEWAILNYGGPSVCISDERWAVQFILGGYHYLLELDDDHPKQRGVSFNDRADLQVESWGLALRVDASARIIDPLLSRWGAELLVDSDGEVREARVLTEQRLSLRDSLGALFSGPGESRPRRGPTGTSSNRGGWDVFLLGRGEARYFNLGEKSSYLDFDHDYRAGLYIELVLTRSAQKITTASGQ